MTVFSVLVALEAVALMLAIRGRLCGAGVGSPVSVESTASGRVARGARLLWTSPLVVVLAYALADEVLVEALHRWLFVGPHPVRAAVARHGWLARAAYYVETAVVLGWPAVLAGAAWSLFSGRTLSVFRRQSGDRVDTSEIRLTLRRVYSDLGRSAELLFGAWLVAGGSLAACYPLPRGWTAPLLRAVELAFVAAALAALPAGWRSRAILTREGRALGVVLVAELVVALLGAWSAGAGVFSSWDALARVPYCIGWTVLCAVLAAPRR